jgi:hypothetical protein
MEDNMGKIAKVYEVKKSGNNTGFGGVGGGSVEIARIDISNMTDFSLYVCTTATLTVAYTIKLSPYADSTYDVTQTSTTIAGVSGGVCNRHVFTNNFDGFISVHASATAAYTSGAVNFIISSIG